MAQPAAEDQSAEPAAVEKLAIKTDEPSRWNSGNAKASVDLFSGSNDGPQSSWAHVADDLALEDLLRGAPSRLLQALALFVFSTKVNAAGIRSKVEGVSFARRTLPPDLVRDDPALHIAPLFDHTHRHILIADAATAETARARICAGGGKVTWKYTRLQLAPLLERLLDGGHLRPEHEPVARRIIDESI